MKRYIKLWIIFTFMIFVLIGIMNYVSDLIAPLSYEDSSAPILYVAVALNAVTDFILWPARMFSHPYTQDWVVFVMCVLCCGFWSMPITCLFIKNRKNGTESARATKTE